MWWSNWIAFTPDHIETDLELFRGRTGQYVFISSASAYQKPLGQSAHHSNRRRWRIRCGCIRATRSRVKNGLMRAYREEQFPMTMVRPSHTYDETLSPIHGGYTTIDRMRQGKPVIVHGDGTSLWTLTHHTDFAKGFVGVLGNHQAIGDTFHITSDEVLTWNQIYLLMGHARGRRSRSWCTSRRTSSPRIDRDWGDGLLGDKAHSVIFDNTKIKRLVPDYVAAIPFRAACMRSSRGSMPIRRGAWSTSNSTKPSIGFWRRINRRGQNKGSGIMSDLLAAYLDRLEALHADLNSVIADLPVEALNWSPGPGLNSIAVLAAHTAGSERYWIGDVVARDDSHRERAAEFRTQAASAAE